MYDFIRTTLVHPLPCNQIKADEIETVVDQLLVQSENELKRIEQIKEINYQTIFESLDRLSNRLDDYMVLCSQLESLLSDQALSDAYEKVQPKVSAFYARLPFSQPRHTDPHMDSEYQ